MNSDETIGTENRIPCPLCQGQSRPKATHVSPHNGIRYRLHHCGTCLLEHWIPREFDLTIYSKSGFEAYQGYHSGTRPFPRWAEPLFNELPQGIQSAVDIGCGDGSVLKRLQANGVAATGIDLDADSVRVANEKCGDGTCSVSTLQPFAAKCLAAGKAFDLVTFFEVLEHQTDPAQFLSDIRTLVRPGGWVAGSVPSRTRFLATVDRRFGDGDFPPHHFLWFSAESLGRLIALSGFVEPEVMQTESVTYSELVGKLKLILSRRISAEKRFFQSIIYRLMLVFAPAVAAFLHLGRLQKPSHIFFRFRRPALNDGTTGNASE